MHIAIRTAARRVLDRPDAELFTLLVGGHALAWSLYAALSKGNLDNYGDMAESFAWGQEWQLGYHKHPPVFAWIAALWFRFFPTEDAAFYVLAMVNVAVGLVAVRQLAGYFLEGRSRIAAALTLVFCPFYTFYAFRYNANTILLSLWPLAALFFYRSFRDRGVLDSLCAGLFAALAVLAKYSSGLLLLTLFAAALLHPERRSYFRSAAPYVAAAVLLAAVAPHLRWLFDVGFLPFAYAGERVGLSEAETVARVLHFAFDQLLNLAPLLAVMAWMLGRSGGALRRFWDTHENPGRALPLLLCFGPFVLTALVSLALRVDAASVWGIPMWFALPLAMLTTPGLRFGEIEFRRGFRLIAALLVGVPLAAPLVYAAYWTAGVKYVMEPRRELAEELSRMFSEQTGEPLRVVAGTPAIAASMAFYAPEHPSWFIGFDLRQAPWITSERLEREGLAIVCEAADRPCVDIAQASARQGGVRSEVVLQRHSILGTGRPFTYVVTIVPPGVSDEKWRTGFFLPDEPGIEPRPL